MMETADLDGETTYTPWQTAEQLTLASKAKALLSPADIFSIVFVVLAVLVGFVGGLLIAPAVGFLVASGELLVVGIFAGFS